MSEFPSRSVRTAGAHKTKQHRHRESPQSTRLSKDLLSEIQIFHSIYEKYRSQQRNQRWWRQVSMLHRRLIRLVQADRINSSSIEPLTPTLFSSVGRALHSVLAQGAFITLGFALLACTARIYTLISPFQKQKSGTPDKIMANRIPENVVDVDDMDLGVAVEDDGHHITRNKPSRKQKPIKDKKESKEKTGKPSKKKSARSAIDDIFG